MNLRATTCPVRTTLGLLLTGALMLGAVPTAHAADSPDFGVLYTGEYDDADARVFRERMRALGWYEEVYKTSHAASSVDRPRHYNFTHGPDDRQTQAGDDTDLLYVSGHGWRRAKIPIYDNRPEVVDSISADSACVGGASVHPWEIGVDWFGQFPSNESRWDYDIEWAIFAACLQLDDRTTIDKLAYSHTSPRESSAKAWGRTLLGTPSRMHGIFGYWDIAPAGSYDIYVLNDFFEHAVDHDDTIGTAWAQANAKYGWSWAFLTHAANRSDRLHGQGAGPTADTASTSAYAIDYYKSSLSGRILDGRGGAYEQLSDARPTLVPRWLDALVGGIERAFADEADSSVRTAKRAFTLPRQGGGAGKRYASLGAAPLLPDPVGMLQSAPASVESSSSASGASALAMGVDRGRDGRERAVVRANGRFEYHSGRGVGTTPVNVDGAKAVKIAEEYLHRLDPALADAVPADVRAVTRERFEFDSSEVATPTVVQYEVRFTQRLDGLYIDGPGVGACVTVDAQGIGDAYGYWIDPTSTRRRTGRTVGKDARRVLEMNGDAVETLVKLPDGDIDLYATDIILHVDPDVSGDLTPAWRYETNEGSTFYLRADGSGVIE